MNPLADLCARLGLVPERVAALAGVTVSAARDALSLEPPPAVAAYIAIAAAIGVRMRLLAGPPLTIWLDRAALDGLYADAAFRAGRGLPPLPATRGELRAAVVNLRKKGRKSLGEIVEQLEHGHIPTAEGLPAWRRSTVAQHLNSHARRRGGKALPDDERRLEPAPAALVRWRDQFVTGLLTEVCPADPFWSVRFGVERREEGDRIILAATAAMPEKVREWIVKGFGQVPWLVGRWGQED